MTMKFFPLIFVSILIWVYCPGQVTVHFDKPYYLAGEYVFYSFCHTGLPPDTLSARAELFSEDNIVDSYYITIKEQCGEGYFKIPYGTTGGIYHVRIAAHLRKSFEIITLAQAPLTIYNDEEIPGPVLHQLADTVGDLMLSPAIILPADSVRIRDEVRFMVTIPEAWRPRVKRISVSVRDYSVYGTREGSVYEDPSFVPAGEWIRGVPVHGVRQLINPGPVRNPLLFAFNPEEMAFDGTSVQQETDEFWLELEPFYEKQQVFFMDYLDNAIAVTQRLPALPAVTGQPLSADSGIVRHLEIYREEKLINRLFKQLGQPVNIEPDFRKQTGINPEHRIDVQDFTIRGTSVDLFREISSRLKFRPAGRGRWQARVVYEFNDIVKFYSRAPLFLVNGRATRDGHFIAGLPLQEIGYFRIFSDYLFLEKLSPMAHGGIIYVDMIDPHYVIPEEIVLPSLTVNGLQSPLQYPVTPFIGNAAPSLGSLLYWNPALNFEGVPVSVDFRIHDIRTPYLIEVVLHLTGPGRAQVLHQVVNVQHGS